MTIGTDQDAEMARPAADHLSHIQHAEAHVAEVHGPASIVDRLESDDFSRQTVGQVPLRALKGDHPVGIRALEVKMRRIFWLGQLAGIGTQ